jgi:hypothetical protein
MGGSGDTNTLTFTLDNALEHFGVKGMKWGVRNRPSGRASKSPPSIESVRKTQINKKAKRSGKKALTNAELQDAINRMQLEQQWSRLRTNERNVAVRFISSVLLDVGKQQVTSVAKEVVSKEVSKRTSKK